MTVALWEKLAYSAVVIVVVQSKGSLINVVAKEGGNSSARETSSYPKHRATKRIEIILLSSLDELRYS